ncbi:MULTISPECIES: hypothetical protein [Providencia]|uniref:Uncharacterized protein n=1 Tax=Providencia rettgeri TaxID=587 RepID=A0AAW6UN94_PRORE|nr:MULTISPECIES: hypothetical protein [Providencia]MDI9095083.1 hypothetical protein [Providencia rettgeri]
MAPKTKHVDKSQLSFMHILEADEITYVAQYEESYDFRYSSKVAYEMIRDSLYLMTFFRSNLQQRIDEISWLFSDVNQDDICSFHTCCKMNGLDPHEVHMSVLHGWKRDLEEKQSVLKCPNHPRYNVVKNYIDCELAGYEKYVKAFYITYPYESAKRKTK